MDKRVIEILGVAGAGKSHICGQLQASAPPRDPKFHSNRLRAMMRVLSVMPILPLIEFDRTFFLLNRRIKFRAWDQVRGRQKACSCRMKAHGLS